jgi:hypothetical protein
MKTASWQSQNKIALLWIQIVVSSMEYHLVDSLPLLGGQLLKLLDGTHEMLTSSEGPMNSFQLVTAPIMNRLQNVSVGRGL